MATETAPGGAQMESEVAYEMVLALLEYVSTSILCIFARKKCHANLNETGISYRRQCNGMYSCRFVFLLQ